MRRGAQPLSRRYPTLPRIAAESTAQWSRRTRAIRISMFAWGLEHPATSWPSSRQRIPVCAGRGGTNHRRRRHLVPGHSARPGCHNTGGAPPGRNPVGWVNSAFLEFLPQGLPVTLDEVPACVDHIGEIAAVRGSHPASGIYALESAYLSAHCLRVVVTFGSGEMPFTWDVARNIVPADSVPEVLDVWNHFSLAASTRCGKVLGRQATACTSSTPVTVSSLGAAISATATLTALPDRGSWLSTCICRTS